MDPIAYIHGRTRSDATMPSPPTNLVFLDIGEKEPVAMVRLTIPPSQESAHETGWCYAQLVRMQRQDIRRRLIADGKVQFCNGHTEDDLADEVAKASFERVSARSRR